MASHRAGCVADTALVLDHGSHIFIWLGSDHADGAGAAASAQANGWTRDVVEAAAQGFVAGLADGRFPVPEVRVATEVMRSDPLEVMMLVSSCCDDRQFHLLLSLLLHRSGVYMRLLSSLLRKRMIAVACCSLCQQSRQGAQNRYAAEQSCAPLAFAAVGWVPEPLHARLLRVTGDARYLGARLMPIRSDSPSEQVAQVCSCNTLVCLRLLGHHWHRVIWLP